MKRRTWKRTLLVLLLFIAGGAIVNVAVAWGIAIWGDQEFSPAAENMADFAWPFRPPQGFPKRPVAYGTWNGCGIRKHTFTAYVDNQERRHFPSFDLVDADGAGELHPEVVSHLKFQDQISARAEIGEPAIVFAGQTCTGWPVQSMTGMRWSRYLLEKNRTNEEKVITGSLEVGIRPLTSVWTYASGFSLGQLSGPTTTTHVEKRLLPLTPLWPGLAINTIFYAAILFGGRLLFIVPGFVRRRIRVMRNLCPACKYPVGTSPVCTECGTPLRIQKS